MGGFDGVLAKFDLDGNQLWAVQFGTRADDFPSNVVVDATGVSVSGSTFGTFPGQRNRGENDVFLARFDGDGSQDWVVQFGSRRSDTGYANAIGPAGVYVNGFTDGRLAGARDRGGLDAYVGLFEPDGSRVWLRQFGSNGADLGFGIAADATGVYISGLTAGSMKGFENPHSNDAFVRKFSTEGATLWTQQFGGRGSQSANGLAVLGNEVYAVGDTNTSLGGQPRLGRVDAFARAFGAADGREVSTLQFGTAKFDTASWAFAGGAGLYVVGVTLGAFEGQTRAGESDAYLARIDVTTTA